MITNTLLLIRSISHKGGYLLEGFLVKAKGGFYFVKLDNGEVLRCRARGRLKEEGVSLVVGDRVEVRLSRVGDGIIEKIFPRQNILPRPPVANVDQAIVVVSLREPPLDLYLLHRIIIAAAANDLESVICFNKTDLVNSPGEQSRLQELDSVFTNCGYKVLCSSSLTGDGLDQLREQLRGKISVLAGPSGAGKSTLLNTLKPQLALRTAPLSPKRGRGRHTTRHVELLTLDQDILVADTPGFQRLDLERIPARELSYYFPEMLEYGKECRFSSNCLHNHEPSCAVKDAVQAGKIAPWRYKLYISLLGEIEQQESIHR